MSTHVPGSVLVAGSGSIAKRHVRNLLSLGVAQVVVWTAREVAGEDPFADPAVRVTPDLPTDLPSVAIVANATDQHLGTARQLLDRGVHVLVEKPLAVGPSPELTRLCHDASAAGIVGRVAHNLRFVGALTLVKKTLESGALGRPLFARIEVGQWLPDWRPDRPVEEVYSASVGRGGGVALDLSHEVDYMTMLFGYPDSWTVSGSRTGALPIESADVFDAIYSYASGFSCTVHMDYLERRPRRRLRIVGSDGVLECDLVAQEFRLEDKNGVRLPHEAALFDLQATYADEVSAFFAEVDGVAASDVRLPTLDEGAALLRLLSNAEQPGDIDAALDGEADR